MSRLLRNGLRQSVRDYAEVAQWRDGGAEYGKGQPTDTMPFGGNVDALARRKYIKPFKWFKFNRARRATAK